MPSVDVLVVDDEECVRLALRRDLGSRGYRVHMADRPLTAFEKLREEHIDIVISDNAMPGMTGLQFLRLVRDRYPQAIRIMLTGQASLHTAVAAVNSDEVFRLLLKPWEENELEAILQVACQRMQRTGSLASGS